jgi:hypothetical protein
VARGSSPFYPDEQAPPPIDRSQIVSCPVEGCISRFLNESFLARHHESKHARVKNESEFAAGVALVRATSPIASAAASWRRARRSS